MKIVANFFDDVMAKNVVILVDGQNLYYSLKGIGIKEIELKWDDLFQSLLEPNDELIRTYWFRPQKLHEPHFDLIVFRRNYVDKNYAEKKSEWADISKIPSDINKKIEEEYGICKDWYDKLKDNFKTGEYKYDQLAYSGTDIEIVKAGILKFDPFTMTIIGEKGVDVSLCVKMLQLVYKNKCDKIILISGDYDTSEAVKAAKDEMKKVHIVKFHKGYPPENKNLSKDLSILADKILDVYEKDLRSKFLK